MNAKEFLRCKQIHVDTQIVNQSVSDETLYTLTELLEEYAASRDSRTLSAVPSDSQIDVIFSEYCNLYESEDGNYSALESDDFALAVKELFKRGIAG